ncbi:MAG TPA: Fic family protein [Saprospiraceae bacterium]|nr:Fic family protein [Saprospiraceae bacterium]
MNNIFDKIDQLQSELSGLTISDKDQRSLDEKFRLEFNYNSNHMEGNTLTYQDTKVLLLKDILPQGKLYEMRELDEMRAHDAAFEMIKEWATDPSREINQNDIRELNRIILVKDFYKDAIDLNGNPTRKKIKVGEYKEFPNSVLLQNGEVFHYADPIEVPALMGELMDWYRDEKDGLHPITLAGVFHHKFVLIHPFDDGNGRISRLLMNYILMRHGYPPVVIKSSNKDKYLNALRLADAGDMESFITYIAEQAEWSLEITIKAAKGESIEEANDWEKELAMLSKREDTIPSLRTVENTIERNQDSIFPMLRQLYKVIEEKFTPLFESSNFQCVFNQIDYNAYILHESPQYQNMAQSIIPSKNQQMKYVPSLLNYKKNGLDIFSIQNVLYIDFTSRQYKIFINEDPKNYIDKLITETLSENEIQDIINEYCRHVVNEIKRKATKLQW